MAGVYDPFHRGGCGGKRLMEYEGPAQQIRRDVHNFVVQSLDCRVLMEVKENE